MITDFMSFFKDDQKLPDLFWVPKAKWSLQDKIIPLKAHYGGTYHLTLQDSFRGFQVFGSTGSGKTSGSGKLIAECFLKSGFGGIVLVVKSDEVETWRKYCENCNRSSDLVIIEPDGLKRFNFLSELSRNQNKPLDVVNISQLILDVYALYTRSNGERSQDSFWIDQLQSCLNHTIVLSFYKDGALSAEGIYETFRSAVNHAENFEALKARGQKTSFERMANALTDSSHENYALDNAIKFYLNDFKSLAEKTRSIIVAMFGSLMEPLIQSPMREVFSGLTTIKPEDTFLGKIIVINLPIHQFRKAGLLTQLIWKMSFMNAVMERSNPERPVFLWADESQYFIEERDIQFLTTARSKRCSVVYLTQNFSNYEAALSSPSKVSAILGSMNNKIYHQNNDPRTNEFASNSIGKVMTKRESHTSGPQGSSSTTSEHLENDVIERVFTGLKSGGVANNLTVEAIVHIPGHKFKKGRPWFRGEFRQAL